MASSHALEEMQIDQNGLIHPASCWPPLFPRRASQLVKQHPLDTQGALYRHHFSDLLVDAVSPDLLLFWRRASISCKAPLKKFASSVSSVLSATTRFNRVTCCLLPQCTLARACRWSLAVFDRLQLIPPFVEQSVHPPAPGRARRPGRTSSSARRPSSIRYRPSVRFFATRSSFRGKGEANPMGFPARS